MNVFRRILSVLIAIILCLGIFGCSGKKSYGPVTDVNNLEGRSVGVNMTWSADYMLSERNDLKVVRFNTTAEIVMALRYGQIDVAAMEKPNAVEVLNCISGLGIVDQPIATDSLAFAVNAQKTDLLEEINEFLEVFDGSDEQADIFERLNSDDGYEYYRVEPLTGGKTLTVGLATDSYPYSYVDFDTGEYQGSDVEVITRFANEYGYSINFVEGVFTTIEMGVVEGDLDLGIGAYCNASRKDAELVGAFYMSKPYMKHEIVLIEVVDRDNIKVLVPLDY